FPGPRSAVVLYSNLAWQGPPPPVSPALMRSPGHPGGSHMPPPPAPPSRIFSSTLVILSPLPRPSMRSPSVSDRSIPSFSPLNSPVRLAEGTSPTWKTPWRRSKQSIHLAPAGFSPLLPTAFPISEGFQVG